MATCRNAPQYGGNLSPALLGLAVQNSATARSDVGAAVNARISDDDVRATVLVRIVLSTSHVVYLVKTGKLKAMRTKDGPRQCWKIDVSSSDCARQVQMFEQLTNGMVKES